MMIQEHIHSAFCVSRVIAVEQSSVANAINDALDALQCQLPGIQALALDKLTCKLTLAYDTAVVSFSAILAQLMQAGIYPVDTRWFRLKSAWYDYTDQNAAEQAHAKPKGCCNRAPGV